MTKPTVVSLFSGAGGMDLGFIQSGYRVIWANDFQKDAVTTYQKNIGDHIVYGDIAKITKDQLPQESVDVVLGGFPCQGFSVANTKRSMEDKRNFLYLELLRVVKELQPKFFVAENVKGLLSMQNGQVLNMILKDFENLGYRVDYQVLNTANHGVPQSRERVIIIGNRIGVKNPFPTPTYTTNTQLEPHLKPTPTVEESIGFLQSEELVNGKLEDRIIVNNRFIYNHVASTNVADSFFTRKNPPTQEEIVDYLNYYRKECKLSIKKIDEVLRYRHTAGHWFRKDKYGSLPSVSDWWKLKDILQFDDTYDKQMTELIEKEITFEQSLRITNWDRPSDTITASTPEIHVNKQRRLSVRESAILQSFPDNFIFYGSLTSMYRQVGNAVPPKLAKAIAKEIKPLLK